MTGPNEPDLPETVRGSSDPEATRLTPDRTLPRQGHSASPAGASSLPSTDKYEIRGELGHGGLGRVMTALDRDVGREVAFKVMREDVPAEYAERFLREGRVTGRLEHPNIVPVYDVGVRIGEDGVRQVYFAMKKIAGRDLAEVLHGPAAPSLRELVDRFHDVCLAVAYAHSRGVLHRDLKPSNIMLGEFGETLVVDWGLAKVKGAVDPPSADERRLLREARIDPQQTPLLTMEGEVLGTPAYMSPEQAGGRVSEVDEQSDVWSLGAILYEIMTLHPPFEGRTADEVISRVRTGRVTPPSERVGQPCATAESAAGAETGRSPAGSRPESPSSPGPADEPVAAAEAATRPIPPELETICLKCLAIDKRERYRSAEEAAREIRLFLDGVKERERHHRLAVEAVAKARGEIDRYHHLGEVGRQASAEAAEASKRVKPIGDKSELWAIEDRARALQRDAVEAFASADSFLTTALGYERHHAEARRLKAELFWGKFLEAEEKGDEAGALYHRRLVERYNDGAFDALLKGDGFLTVRTRSYPCRCLVEGREVRPEELDHLGYHPFSGRALAGYKGAEGVPDLEPAGPVRLKVHGASCEPAPVAGARVWLWRYEEVERLLIPVTPESAVPPLPPGEESGAAGIIDSVFAPDSPYRPRGPGLYLGATPIEATPLPMGSYLLIVAGPRGAGVLARRGSAGEDTVPPLSGEGSVSVRCPVSIPRCGNVGQDITLFRPEEVPPGFIPVPAGAFGYQGDPENPFSQSALTVRLEDYFIARHPVTCREYLEFLNDRARTAPEEARRRVPRDTSESGHCWPGPPHAVPTAGWLERATPEARASARRLESCPVEWEEDWPVFSISWEDSLALAAWERGRGGWLTTLLKEWEWEKATRGPDRRWFPWGRHFDLRWCNASRSLGEREQPAPVNAFPHDESPYGVRGLVGNSRDFCLDIAGPERPGWRVARGGAWTDNTTTCRPTVRFRLLPRSVCSIYGARLGAPVRLGPAPSL